MVRSAALFASRSLFVVLSVAAVGAAIACGGADEADPTVGPATGKAHVSGDKGGASAAAAGHDAAGASAGGSADHEICDNGLDDDGNGLADDNCTCKSGATEACFTGAKAKAGKGVCAEGVQTCVGQSEFVGWGECTGEVLGSDKEICGNGLDDDCNGEVDDGCGGHGGAGGVGVGTGGVGGAATCVPIAEICGNGKDDDCDGTIDDGCGGAGAGGAATCVPAPGGVEICGNGKDDDCNGKVDDTCAGGCVPDPGGVEICGNMKDDNCDGSVDENCPCEPGQPHGPEICDGVKDDDCDGVVDNGCDCTNGATQDCSSQCGAGSQTCVAGHFGACSAPAPDATGCPCPAGQFKGTDGGCFTQASCATKTDDGNLTVGGGDTKSKTEKCPAGYYATEGHYSGTSMDCDWDHDDTSVTLTCHNDAGGDEDADHVTIYCSCTKPGKVETGCSNCD